MSPKSRIKSPPTVSATGAARAAFHQSLFSNSIITITNGIVSVADKDSKLSCRLALDFCQAIGVPIDHLAKPAGQTSGSSFEDCVQQYVESAFGLLSALRPGQWRVAKASKLGIAEFEQFAHLIDIDKFCEKNKQLRAFLGSSYIIKPDVIVARIPVEDSEINRETQIVADDGLAMHTSLRAMNNPAQILHASLSCKLTLRSDRAQNARTEALNLMRNRKGRVPHICVITAEPLPSRLASLALGTGDVDCVYHIALPELEKALLSSDAEDSIELFATMRDGRRLRDISDLAFDLAI